ncbi:hypothetical protein [Mucilaginibacter sp. FT3.2]|uniref:hypothetical protein n=1 Tax=Mucilaginibacter sp. FT3.2 TaxID=2723090 RepID=UPI001609F3A2|nr:hypothetical protein [Mucilaginibacter sp. FT3.2]MBB6233945.1 hypothetical protein [Mucilaginibacter sp. FT3.2]
MMKRILTLIIILSIISCGKKAPVPAPGVASLTAPLKDQPCLTGTVLSATESSVAFSWNPSQNTDNYDLTITNLLTKTATTQTVSTTTATVKLLRNTPYSWYISSKAKKTSVVTKSDVWKFYNAGAGVVTYAPFPAEITGPAFGAVVASGTTKVNLTWKGSSVSSNIVAYDVYFGPSSNPDLFRNHITDSFVNDVNVGANTTYYWRVVTVDANGNISDSGTYNFFVSK